ESPTPFRQGLYQGTWNESRTPHIAKKGYVSSDCFHARIEGSHRQNDPAALTGTHGSHSGSVDVCSRQQVINASRHVHIGALIVGAFRLGHSPGQLIRSI